MKYKVGDKVKYCSEICTITEVLESQGKFKYRVQSDTWFDIINEDEMIEGLVEEEEIEFTEEDKYWCDIMSESDPTTYVLPQGYQFVDENGIIINATKIVLEKKKKEYPKTYEECCEIVKVGKEHTLEGTTIRINYKIALLESFQKLLICRDAYWKIAGDEMGLGKPWEPSKDKMVYSFYRHSNEIETDIFSGESATFEFPTKEMRDAFKENFKELIKSCKELL